MSVHKIFFDCDKDECKLSIFFVNMNTCWKSTRTPLSSAYNACVDNKQRFRINLTVLILVSSMHGRITLNLLIDIKPIYHSLSFNHLSKLYWIIYKLLLVIFQLSVINKYIKWKISSTINSCKVKRLIWSFNRLIILWSLLNILIFIVSSNRIKRTASLI